MTVGLARVPELDAVDAEIRGNPPERRLAERRARSAPPVDAFRRSLQGQRARVFRESRPCDKLPYIARHWNGLKTFLDYGRVERDSNCVERKSRYWPPPT